MCLVRQYKLQPTVYVLVSKRSGNFYIGVTSDPVGRVWQHKQDAYDSFTSTYGVKLLGYYETLSEMRDAIIRE